MLTLRYNALLHAGHPDAGLLSSTANYTKVQTITYQFTLNGKLNIDSIIKSSLLEPQQHWADRGVLLGSQKMKNACILVVNGYAVKVFPGPRRGDKPGSFQILGLKDFDEILVVAKMVMSLLWTINPCLTIVDAYTNMFSVICYNMHVEAGKEALLAVFNKYGVDNGGYNEKQSYLWVQPAEGLAKCLVFTTGSNAHIKARNLKQSQEAHAFLSEFFSKHREELVAADENAYVCWY